MKHLNATFEIENDLQEYNLRKELDAMNVKYMRTLADVEHLKQSTHYKALLKAKRNSQLNLDRFINDNRK